MAKGHRSQIKRERNEVKDTRPSAKLSYARMSVQKACFVLDAIRGKDVDTALAIVMYNPRYASSVIEKLLKSAIANAENNNGLERKELVVAECYANKGPTMKNGSATPVLELGKKRSAVENGGKKNEESYFSYKGRNDSGLQ